MHRDINSYFRTDLTAVERFERVFQVPSGLPPRWEHAHALVLKEGAFPISVRPYRYPQIQKNGIERLVREMLAAR